MQLNEVLTDRQQRELEYHKDHAAANEAVLHEDFSYDVVEPGPRRWWNQYWAMYTYLLEKDLAGKKVLIIGAGFGEDALVLAKVGAEVKAFDLSPDSVSIAQKRAEQESLDIEFRQMAAEKLDYDSDYFDIVVARDILHHVEIEETMSEVRRVLKKGGILCFNEIYSHSITDRIRYSKIVDKWLYPKMTRFIYQQDKPYITEDEEKLSEKDVNSLLESIEILECRKYFNCVVTRIIPERLVLISKLDQALLRVLSVFAPLLGSRVLVGGVVGK